MSNRKHPIAPDFDWRLKVALDRITPPSAMPRYAMARPGDKSSMGPARARRPWRLAPIGLAGAAAVLLALTAVAATGSANPVVWSERAASTIQSVGHAPEPSPNPTPGPEGSPNTPRSVAPAAPARVHAPAAAPKPSPSPTEHPEETPRPTPSDDHPGHGSPNASPAPSPTPDEH